MDAFSRKYEAVPVSGKAQLTLGAASWTGTVPSTVLQAWPEGQASLTLRQLGTGKPWATVRSLAAIPLKAPLSSGYRMVRTVTPVEQKPGASGRVATSTACAWTSTPRPT